MSKNRTMGESKKKRGRMADVLKNATCIYCGGRNAATTVEHLPPRIMFRSKLRPQGLEFPCCVSCNSTTSTADLVAAFMGRSAPNLTTPEDERDNAKLRRAIVNN